jgi:type VI secretion system protein ImpL
MTRLRNAVLSFPALTLAATLVLCASVWFLGPLVAFGDWRPLGDFGARAIAVAALAGAALLVVVLVLWRRRARERRLSAEIVQAAPAAPGAAASAEVDQLRAKLTAALAQLRRSKLGRGHLYQLPWYVVIGPPGAGKTTAIVNSGLQFPLGADAGKAAIGGVGGTRNCDWWFTNDAVLIDTAGRYTTQESDAGADNAAWVGFLGLLKKYRTRQPINGAIVAISLSDLTLQDAAMRGAHARAIHARLKELRDRLGIRFPVYVLFTKADLIAGFSEFFEGLSKEEREQVWGFTFDLDAARGEASPVAAFGAEFDALTDRLNAQSVERIQAESDHARRSLIAGFPGQFASLRQVAGDFLAEVFQDSRYEDRQLLRGVYFTSGTQEGTPIDRLMSGMARTFGIGRQAVGAGRGAGRSYFLTGLLQRVVFPEAGLVSADDRVERRYRLVRAGAIAAAVLVALGLGTLWTRSFLGNRALVAEAEGEVAAYRATAAAIPGSPIGDTDLPAVVPALNILRDMPGNPALGDPPAPAALGWGLYQGDVIGTQAAQAYRAALNQHLLPRLLLRLEEQIQGNLNNPELLYEALKVYLILGLQGPMDRGFVTDWMTVDWSLAYPDPSREPLRADLATHLAALISQPMTEIALNGHLVEQVQAILAQMPLAERIYTGIVSAPAVRELPPWRPIDHGGPAIGRAMTRSSGAPLTEGIEGIYTYDGFNDVFLNEALQVAQRIQRESWVLGPLGEAEQSEAALAAMSRDVLDLYYVDFIQRYEALLGDLDILPMQSLSHAVEITNVLSGPTSPIADILTAVAAETRLTEDRDTGPAADAAAAAGAAAGAVAAGAANAAASPNRVLLEALVGAVAPSAEAAAAPAVPGAQVEDRFAWLHALTARDAGQPSQLDGTLASLKQVYDELNRMAIAGGELAPPGDASAIQRFQQEAARLPGPLPRWASQIAAASSGVTAEGTRAQLNARWQSQILPFCEQAIANRYPFDPRSGADVATQDFARLFAPGGLIDGFVSENLIRFIDTTTRPWSWRPVGDADLGLSPAVLEQLQNAAEIRDAFFAGGAAPQVTFEIMPEALDPQAQTVLLEIDGQEVSYTHGDRITPVGVRWPGSVGLGRVSFSPAAINAENALMRDGPWAWFRLLNAAQIRPTNDPDQKRVIFSVGGRIAIFQMRSGTALNPFGLPALGRFSCPASL